MNEKYLLLGASILLTLLSLAVLGGLGLQVLSGGFSLAAIFNNVTLDIIFLVSIAKIFALVFGLLSAYLAYDAGLLPKFGKKGDV
jgi:hypothetical protein